MFLLQFFNISYAGPITNKIHVVSTFYIFFQVLTKEEKKICCMSPKETGIGIEHLKLFAKKVPFRCQV